MACWYLCLSLRAQLQILRSKYFFGMATLVQILDICNWKPTLSNKAKSHCWLIYIDRLTLYPNGRPVDFFPHILGAILSSSSRSIWNSFFYQPQSLSTCAAAPGGKTFSFLKTSIFVPPLWNLWALRFQKVSKKFKKISKKYQRKKITKLQKISERRVMGQRGKGKASHYGWEWSLRHLLGLLRLQTQLVMVI